MKSFIKTVLDNADWIATVATWSLITLVVIDILVPGDPIPILPFSEQPVASEVESDEIYSESVYITEAQLGYHHMSP